MSLLFKPLKYRSDVYVYICEHMSFNLIAMNFSEKYQINMKLYWLKIQPMTRMTFWFSSVSF